MSLRLESVQLNDAPMLYRWRFLDKKSVDASLTINSPGGMYHVGWLCDALADGAPMFIGFNFSTLVGAVYFLPQGDFFKVSLMVAPEHREKGYGGELLRMGLVTIPPTSCFAIIKESNEASKKIFRRNNFRPQIEGTSEWTRYHRPADV